MVRRDISLKTHILADCLRFVKREDKKLFIATVEFHFRNLKKKKENITLEDVLSLS